MRALAYFGKSDIRFTTDLREPEIHLDDEIIVDVAWCGICGTDLHEYEEGPIFFPEKDHVNEISGKGLPQAIGHEVSGIVLKVGKAVTKVEVGDHVVVEPCATCLDTYRWPDGPRSQKSSCQACSKGFYNICSYLGLCGAGVQDGGCAERMVINEKHVVPVPKHIPLDVAALVQPIAVSWHAVRISGLQKGKSALILGGGPIGLCTILALHGHGCRDIVVSEPAEIRRNLAEKMGAKVFNPLSMEVGDAIAYLKTLPPGGDGFDFSFDCSGVPSTFKAAVECLTFRGTAVNVAVWGHKPVDFLPMDVTSQEKHYTGSMCYTMTDFEAVVEAFKKGTLDLENAKHMITGKVSIENGLEKAILKLLTAKQQTIKILLSPNNHGELD